MGNFKKLAINTSTAGISAAVGAVITIIITYFLVDIPVLKSQVNDLRDNKAQLLQKLEETQKQLVEVEKKYYLIEQFLYLKFNYSPAAFMSVINMHNTPSAEAKKALSIQSQSEAEPYLIKNLGFTPDEAKAALSKPNTPSK